jgi:hypothetical protein
MPHTLPTDQGWYPGELIGGRYITVFEVLKDPDDAEWDADSDQYVEDRRAFWSEADGQGLLATLNTGTPWIFPDRLRSVGRLDSSAGDLRTFGTIGLQAKFSVEIANEDGLLDDMVEGRAVSGASGAVPGATTKEKTSPWENRWGRLGIMHHDPGGTLAYPSSVLWLACGRISEVQATGKSWKIQVEDDRVQAKLDVPRAVYRNDESEFAGFRAASSIHGKVKPWLFGHVPIAAGKTVVLGVETVNDLKGRLIEFYDVGSESWQYLAGGSVSSLKYGHRDLVDATWTRGMLEINDATGGWVSTRSDYTATSDGTGFYFANFNEAHLYLKMDVRFTYADLKRDTVLISGITDPAAILDPSVATYAEYPDTVGVQYDRVGVPLPFPSFGDFNMRIEGVQDSTANPDGWQTMVGADDRNMYPGFYLFLKATNLATPLSADGAVFAHIEDYGTVTGYEFVSFNGGPGRYFFNPSGDLDNFHGNRDLYRMYQYPHIFTPTPDWEDSPKNTRDLGMHQGRGWYLTVGVITKAATTEGDGVRVHNVGVRVWGRIDFPDDGFYADAYGYEFTGTMGTAWADVSIGDTLDSPLGVLGLFLAYILPTQGPDRNNFRQQDIWWDDLGLEIGKQLDQQTDAFDEIDELCQDTHVLLVGSNNLAEEITGSPSDEEGHRAVWLPKLAQPVHRFNDTGPRIQPDADQVLGNYPLGAFESGVEPGSVKPRRGRLDDVFTRFVYRYRYSPMRNEYDGLVTVSPTEWELGEYMVDVAGTWLDKATIQALLDKAATDYQRNGELATLTYEASWVHDGATAEYLLAFLIRNVCRPRHGVTLTTGMLPIHVRLGDPVQVDLQDLPLEWQTVTDSLEEGEDERLYVVTKKDVDLKKGRITWDLMEIRPLERYGYVPSW